MPFPNEELFDLMQPLSDLFSLLLLEPNNLYHKLLQFAYQTALYNFYATSEVDEASLHKA